MRVRMAERVKMVSTATRVLVLPASPDRTVTTVGILCLCTHACVCLWLCIDGDNSSTHDNDAAHIYGIAIYTSISLYFE